MAEGRGEKIRRWLLLWYDYTIFASKAFFHSNEILTNFSLIHIIARFSVNGKPDLYVFNAFFMAMRSKFVGEENAIHCYVVEWDPSKLSWASFRNDILG